jgi:hypothetical protein
VLSAIARQSVATRVAAVVLVALAVAGCLPPTLAGRGASPGTPGPAAVTPSVAPTAVATQIPTALPAASPGSIPSPTASPTPTPTPTPRPAKVPVDVNLVANPAKHFITEIRKTWCAASGTQMVLALNGKVALTAAAQAQIVARSAAYWSWSDSHNRGWGPAMIAKVLAAYGVPGYVVKTYRTRAAALLDAAKAIERTHQPAILMVWWGAHTWVVTGFRATADPLVFPGVTVTGTYVLDPWYPRVSSIWGPSDPPGTFQNAKEMVRNYIAWTRPEGRYPARDGLFVAVIPTVPKP